MCKDGDILFDNEVVEKNLIEKIKFNIIKNKVIVQELDNIILSEKEKKKVIKII